MRLLMAVFLGMFVYGLWTIKLGAALAALGMFCFVFWADRKFAAQDRAYAADPRNARVLEPSTNDALTKYDCECMRSKF